MLRKIGQRVSDALKNLKQNKNQDLFSLTREEINRFKTENDVSCTPPYLLVAEDLFSTQQQVFEASVFYLCKIALNQKKYHDHILRILYAYMAEYTSKSIRIAYIKNTVKQLGLVV